MDFIADYFYIIILIVGAIAQWLKSRTEPQDEGRYEREERPYDPEELEEFEHEAERVNTRPAVPPPLPSQVPNLQIKSRSPLVQAAANMDASEELARQQALIDKAREFKRTKRARATRKPQETLPKTVVFTAPDGSIKSRLHTRRELRSAFVMKEILEKPIGLR